jgi:RNA polymerase sigma-54 factor
MYQRQFQKIQHQTTAHLAQTMTLLSMNNGELGQEIEKILNENPALEMNTERRCPQCKRKLVQDQICPVCSRPKTNDSEESIVFLSQSSDFYKTSDRYSEDSYSDDDMSTELQNLSEYVLRQIVFDLEEVDRSIAAYLINLLNEDGFIEEEEMSTAQYFHVPISKIQEIKNIIKRADPIGVGAASPEEAMITQVEILGENQDIPKFVKELINNGLDLLSKKNYDAISKKLNISEEFIKEAAEFITNNLNPFPARAYWGTTRNPTSDVPSVFIKPDAIIQLMNNDPNLPLIVEVIIPYIGTLEINSLYKQAIQDAEMEKKGDLKSDLDTANLFIKCLQQRNNTMQRLMEKVTNYQKTFINQGEKYLNPMTRAELAKELEVHESTISRAVANKSVQLPDGRIIPLSKFFDRSLSVRAELKEIIKAENIEKPLSDTKIKDILDDRGYEVARRTVAKYRSMEGILPAYLRRKQEP